MKNQRKSREKLRRLKIQLDSHREESSDSNSSDSHSNRLPLGD